MRRVREVFKLVLVAVFTSVAADVVFRSTSGKGSLFETFLVNSTGWGADPQGNLRVSVEQPEWYRFDATYRRFKYFRFLNNFANPKLVCCQKC